MNKKKPTKISTHFVTSKVTSNVYRVPKYSSLTLVKRNILCADDEQLKFMPFLGDPKGDVKSSVFKRLVKELNEAYSAKRSGSSEDNEMALRLSTYLDGWLEELDLGLDRQGLIRYILEEDGDSFGKSRKEINFLKKAVGSPLAPHLAEIAATFSEVFKTVFRIDSINAVILPDQLFKEMLEKANNPGPGISSGRSQSESPKSQNSGAEHTTERLGTFTNLTCLICGAISCQTHGDYHRAEIHNSDNSAGSDSGEVAAEEYDYNHIPISMHYDEILRIQDCRLSKDPSGTHLSVSKSTDAPCSKDCYRTFNYVGETAEMNQDLIVAVKSFMISMRPNILPCTISFLLNVPCWQVHWQIQDMQRFAPRFPEPPRPSLSKTIDWYDNKRRTLHKDWQELTEAHLHQERTQANPVRLKVSNREVDTYSAS